MRHPWTIEHGVRFLAALQESPGLDVLVPTDRHARVLADIVAEVPGLSGNIVHDTRVSAPTLQDVRAVDSSCFDANQEFAHAWHRVLAFDGL
jgi:hypothetical protein